MKTYNDEELMEVDMADYREFLVKQLTFNEGILKYNFLYTLLPFIVLIGIVKVFDNRLNYKLLSAVTSIYIGFVLIVLLVVKVRSIFLKKRIKEVDFVLEDEDDDF